MHILKMAAKVRLSVSILAALCTTLFLSTTFAAPPVQARSETYNLDIPAQSLKDALQALALASHHKLLYSSELVDGKRSPALKGQFTTEQAVKVLLSGTELSYEVTSDGLVLIRASGPPDGTNTAAPVTHDGADHSARLAQANPAASSASSAATTVNPSAPNKEVSSDTGSEKSALDEIVVTAQKREERLIDVPISIVALSSDELDKRNIISINDLAMVVPGLSIQNEGGVYRYIEIRGVSNSAGTSPLIGLNLDEADVSPALAYMQPDLQTYDLERVEVLRGPQGTIYGNGSMGGTIRFITKNPVLDRFSMNADVTALFTEDGAPSQRIEEVVNIPLIENHLGLRIAGTFDHEGGWIDQPAADVENFNEQNLVDVRPKLLWQPIQQFTAVAMVVIHRNDAGLSGQEDANGNFTQAFNLTTTPEMKDDYNLNNLVLTYDFAAVRILNTTSYMDQHRSIANYGGVYAASAPPSLPGEYLDPLTTINSKILTEEFRINSTDSGPWQWTVGGVYRRVSLLDAVPVEYAGSPIQPGAPLPVPFSFEYTNVSNSRAIFGDSSYRLTDQLTLGAGLRYFRDDQTQDNISSGSTIEAATFHAATPRFYVQYKLTDQINTYASASEGFRSGGFNALNQPTYGPESVWTYETGVKTSFADGRLRADVDIFYSDYRNYQIYGILPPPAPPLDISRNGGDALTKGIEWAFTWRPADQWTLSVNGDYQDAHFTKIAVIDSAHEVGDPLDLIPKYTFNATAERDFEWNGKSGFIRLDYNQQGRETLINRDLGVYADNESDVIHMLNFNVGLHWNESLSLKVFAQNLLNDRGVTDPFGYKDVGVGFPTTGTRPRPRTIGINFGMRL